MQCLFAVLCSLAIITFDAADDDKAQVSRAGRNQPSSAPVPYSMDLS